MITLPGKSKVEIQYGEVAHEGETTEEKEEYASEWSVEETTSEDDLYWIDVIGGLEEEDIFGKHLNIKAKGIKFSFRNIKLNRISWLLKHMGLCIRHENDTKASKAKKEI